MKFAEFRKRLEKIMGAVDWDFDDDRSAVMSYAYLTSEQLRRIADLIDEYNDGKKK